MTTPLPSKATNAVREAAHTAERFIKSLAAASFENNLTALAATIQGNRTNCCSKMSCNSVAKLNRAKAKNAERATKIISQIIDLASELIFLTNPSDQTIDSRVWEMALSLSSVSDIAEILMGKPQDRITLTIDAKIYEHAIVGLDNHTGLHKPSPAAALDELKRQTRRLNDILDAPVIHSAASSAWAIH